MRPQTRMKKAREIYAKYRPIIAGLVQEIKALEGQTPTGLKGINYEHSRVMGGKMRDLSDVLMDKEERPSDVMKLRVKKGFENQPASVIRPYASAYRHAINKSTDLGISDNY